MNKPTNDSSPLLSRVVRLRLLIFFSILTALYVLADIFAFPGLRSDFQDDPAILGILVGFDVTLAGLEVLSRIPGFGPTTRRDDD